MFGRPVAALVLGVTFAVAGNTAAQERAQNPEVAAVRRVVEAFAESTQAKNLAGIDTLFGSSRGVHIIEGAGVNHGWADYRDTHLKPELDQFQNFQYRFSSVEAQVRVGVAWAAFRYELIADTSNGHVESEGRGTAVLEKQNNRWVIVHLHTSGRRRNPSGGV
jgi:ketosteroid isomerase-like protein